MINKVFLPIAVSAILIISIWVILPYFHAGFFPTHDGEWAVVRLADMVRTLKDGQFPVRFSGFLNHGYGYPLFNFTYPLPYYLGAVLKLFRFGLVDSVKIIFALSVPVSGIFMFLASRKLWKSDSAGLVSSLLYVLLPYRIVDLYARGSIGESMALALFPIIVWLILRKNILLGLFYAALILSHNIMALLFSPVVILLAISLKSPKIFAHLFMGLGLSAFFWIPAILEKSNIALSLTPIADRSLYFLKPEQLVQPTWGYGLPTVTGGFSYQLGWPHVLALLISGILAVFTKKERLIPLFIFLSSWALIALLFPFSSVIWKVTPFLKEINYPWTLLAPIGFLVALLTGFLTTNKILRYLSFVLVIFAAILVLPNAKPAKYIDKGDEYYSTNDATTTSSDELMPVWVKDKPQNRFSKKVEIFDGSGEISNLIYGAKTTSFNVNLAIASKISVNTIYYPGWKFNEDGKSIPIDFNNPKGIITFDMGPGKHTVIGGISDNPVRFVSNLISVLSLVILLFYGVFKKVH